MMKITRVIDPRFPSNTFLCKPIKNLINRYIQVGKWIDPFANNSIFNPVCYKTNDLNPRFKTDYHLHALEFLKLFETDSIDGVLFDPPYTLRQIKECYEGFGVTLTGHESQMFYTDLRNEIARIVKPHGICISFGYNSTGVGKGREFTKLEILLVNLAGIHNDIIVTVERKNTTLDNYLS